MLCEQVICVKVVNEILKMYLLLYNEYILAVLYVCYRPCYSASCGFRLQYDRSESAILFMGKFAVSYDVIRDYMFHFLEGRLDLNP